MQTDNPAIIFRQFTVSVELRFATSKTGLDSLYNKFCVRFASRVAEGPKTLDLRKLENDREILKLGADTD